ncbi:MAG: hypothetical protein HC802_13795 [Caldilineaceae bacterium]|nr:hypothetical protein [Caldilineaceae bacterium]
MSISKMFTLLGVDYFATPRAWWNMPLMILVGIVIALIFSPGDELLSTITIGIGYGFLIMASSFCHGVGHIISSRLVNAPVTSIVETATVYVTRYDDKYPQPSRVHIGRALGGPLLNLLLGVTAVAINTLAVQNQFVLFFGIVNLAFGLFTLLPIPSLDGAVIWHELRHWNPEEQPSRSKPRPKKRKR